ncbi:hypothetical protein KYK30_20400 [Shinella yambaruensis]|uniref:Uncharacterized protein n=1 Tax=Shinella yambaruensis TaxID=415996 RepID=A0ABQ5ZEK9_9HYPH|nr:hypothetical protein [Shinella yambaruensis]MCJ8027045.1 hypothetical protein [Shinella yambaruensis]MCU7982064.1 hypothetical protein [Shinella yambaruensis]GLR51238.1 hypothetical protein GCM10007923_24460 [Shinella yambaruensis]
MAAKVSIIGQIAEVKRLIGEVEKRYDQMVSAGKMRREEAEMLMVCIHAVLKTLEFCQQHKAGFEEYLAAKKAGTA